MYYCGLYLHSVTENRPENGDIQKENPEHSCKLNSNESSINHSSGDNTAQAKTTMFSFMKQSKVWIVFLVVSNLPIVMYTSLMHQRGTMDVMNFIYKETKYDVKNYNEMNVMFLMPCHSTPFYR